MVCTFHNALEMANQNSNNFQSKERTSHFFPFFACNVYWVKSLFCNQNAVPMKDMHFK